MPNMQTATWVMINRTQPPPFSSRIKVQESSLVFLVVKQHNPECPFNLLLTVEKEAHFDHAEESPNTTQSFRTLFRQCRFVRPYGLRGLSISRNWSEALLAVYHFPSPAFLHSSVNHEIQQSGETADPSVCGDWPTNLALFSVSLSLSLSLSSGGW